MAVQNYTNVKFLIKLTPNEPFTEFEFLKSVDTTTEDNTNSIPTSTGTLQVGDNSTGKEMKLENAEVPRDKDHARLQHRIVTQGKKGFYEAIFEGDANTKNRSSDGSTTVHHKETWRNGTFIADKSWNPTDMMNRTATIKSGEVLSDVDGYDGEGSYQDAVKG